MNKQLRRAKCQAWREGKSDGNEPCVLCVTGSPHPCWRVRARCRRFSRQGFECGEQEMAGSRCPLWWMGARVPGTPAGAPLLPPLPLSRGTREASGASSLNSAANCSSPASSFFLGKSSLERVFFCETQFTTTFLTPGAK